MSQSAKKQCKRCGFAFGINRMRCPSCRMWSNNVTTGQPKEEENFGIVFLGNKEAPPVKRLMISPPLADLNDLFGGGIAYASVNLIGGGEGAGKTTLALQLAGCIAEQRKATPTANPVLYVSAEMRTVDVEMYANRIHVLNKEAIGVYGLGNHNELGPIILALKPCCVVVDSVQGFEESLEGQVELCKAMKSYAILPEIDAPFLVISQLNTADEMAGLRKLRHQVDGTFTLEATEEGELRRMKVKKNRFGPGHRECEMLMTEQGLRCVTEEEVKEYLEEVENMVSEGTGDDDEEGD